MPPDLDHAIARLQRRLQAAASSKLKVWWEQYIKHGTKFRGVGLPRIRQILQQWRRDNGVHGWGVHDQIDLAFALLAEPYAEDKLAGVLYLQDYLLIDADWRTLLRRSERAFARGYVADWNVCDWACVRVWGPLMKRNGSPCREAVAAWTASPRLWQARAGVVSFVSLIGRKSRPPAETRALILRGCRRLIRRDERFAKTAVGWVLRDLSHTDQPAVAVFVARHGRFFTNEVFLNATKRMTLKEREHLRAFIRNTPRGGT